MPSAAHAGRPLLQEVASSYAALSPQLKVIARYVERHHEALPRQRIQDVAARCQVQPSAVVRFAKRFGLRGYQELKQALGTPWETLAAASGHPTAPLISPPQLPASTRPKAVSLDHGLRQVHAALEESAQRLLRLKGELHPSVLQAIGHRLADAQRIWVVGAQRAFPVAAYLADALAQADAPVHWLSLLGGPPAELNGARCDDVLLAVNLGPPAPAVISLVRQARTRGLSLVVLSDRQHALFAQDAGHTLWLDHAGDGLVVAMAAADGLRLARAAAMAGRA